MSSSNGSGKLALLREGYDLSNEAVPIPFTNGITINLRRLEFRDTSNGHQPFQDHMRKFHEAYRRGGQRRQEPTEEEVRKAQKEGICKYIFDGGDLSAEEFREALFDPKMPEFFADILMATSAAVGDFYKVKREPGPEATEAAAGNLPPA